jgi:hypothetical protein
MHCRAPPQQFGATILALTSGGGNEQDTMIIYNFLETGD